MTVPLALAPVTQDIYVPSGASIRLQFRWLISSVPQSLTDMRAVLSIARRVGGDPIITATSTSGEIGLEPADDNGNPQVGVLDALLPAEMTARLRRNARYDLVLIDALGNVMRVFEGAVTVGRGITPVAATDPASDGVVFNLGPARQNLSLYRGDSFNLSVIVRDGVGAPVDLTGYVPTAQVRTVAGTLQATMTVVVNQEAALGRIDLSLTPEQTAALPVLSFYDLQLAMPSGEVRTYLAGSISVTQDITA